MALLTRKEFGALVNESPQYVGRLILYGKLIEKKKRIDTENPVNKIYLKDKIGLDIIKKKVPKPKPKVPRKKAVNPVYESPELPIPKKEEVDNYDDDETEEKYHRYNLDLEKKQKDVELISIRIEKEKLDLTKKQAQLIEIMAAKDIMQRAVIVLSNQYRQTSKHFILQLFSKYNIPDTDLASIQKTFDETINKAVNDSEDLIKTECEIVANELAGKLGVGEAA